MDYSRLINFLAAYGNMNPGLQQLLESGPWHKRLVKKGKSLLLPKMEVDEVYFLETGMCKGYWLNEKFEEVIFQLWMAESMIIPPGPVHADQRNTEDHLVMLEDSELLAMNKQAVNGICSQQPVMEQMLYHIGQQDMAMRNLQLRMLLMREGDRYAFFRSRIKDLHLRLTEKDTCAYLGISKSTLAESKREVLREAAKNNDGKD